MDEKDQQSLMSLSSTNGQQTTLQRSQQPSEVPAWCEVLVAMAQDKRHDLAAATLRLWRAKLEKFSEHEIVTALLSYGWDFFPSVDNVISVINANRQAQAEASRDREWQQYKENQAQAEREGKLASEEDYATLRKECREIMERVKPVTAKPKTRVRETVAEIPSPAD